MEAFLYILTDTVNDKTYIGVHKGTPDDGYVCSSKLVLQEYRQRPHDFTRTIVRFGTFEEMLKAETQMLTEVNAKEKPEYYNLHNGDGRFYNKKHTEETINKIRKANTGKRGRPAWNKGMKGQYKMGPCSEERKIKIGKAKKGRARPDSAIIIRKIKQSMTEEQEMARRQKIQETMKKRWAETEFRKSRKNGGSLNG